MIQANVINEIVALLHMFMTQYHCINGREAMRWHPSQGIFRECLTDINNNCFTIHLSIMWKFFSVIILVDNHKAWISSVILVKPRVTPGRQAAHDASLFHHFEEIFVARIRRNGCRISIEQKGAIRPRTSRSWCNVSITTAWLGIRIKNHHYTIFSHGILAGMTVKNFFTNTFYNI